jgi:hypothetical protein
MWEPFHGSEKAFAIDPYYREVEYIGYMVMSVLLGDVSNLCKAIK